MVIAAKERSKRIKGKQGKKKSKEKVPEYKH